MRIDHLTLISFKRYGQVEADFGPGVNLLVGMNGSGKTTILQGLRVAISPFFQEYAKAKIPFEYDYIKITGREREAFSEVRASGAGVDGQWGLKKNKAGGTENRIAAPIRRYSAGVFEALNRNGETKTVPLIAYYSTQRLFRTAAKSARQ